MISFLEQGKENTLHKLECEQEKWVVDGKVAPPPKVCVICWGLEIEHDSACEAPTYWPIEHALRRLNSLTDSDRMGAVH